MRFIDIERLIRESDNNALKNLPRVAIWFLRIILREKSLNKILGKYQDLEGKSFEDKILEEFKLKLLIKGMENLPENGRCIFCANHPFGILDGLILTNTVASSYGKLKAIGNDAFYLIPALRPFIFTVNVYGMNTKNKFAELNNLYATDFPITHFPSGEVSRKYSGKIQDCEWQKSFISKAVVHQRDIVPFYFKGNNSNLFYFVHWFRKKIGLHLNLELVLLPREIFKKRGKKIEVFIGKPIPYTCLDNSRSPRDWTRLIREYTYELGTGSNLSFEDHLQKKLRNQ
jgi:putative hemolysin